MLGRLRREARASPSAIDSRGKAPLFWPFGDHTSRRVCQQWVADSTGQRNSLVKHLSRSSEVECLARSFIESPGYRIELALWVCRDVDPLGDVLPQQAIGVLVGPALPRVLSHKRLTRRPRARSRKSVAWWRSAPTARRRCATVRSSSTGSWRD